MFALWLINCPNNRGSSHNYYQINEENISLFLNIFDDLRNLESLDRSNYTIINNSKCNNLKKYIEKNIEKYVKNVFLKLPNNTSESKESIVILLNNDKLDVALKTNIILKQELLITDLYEISDYDVWKMLIEQNKIVVTWANLFIYYETLGEESDLDEILINFLNQEKNYNLLSKQKIKTELEGQSEEVIKSFSLKVIECDDLHYESYVALMNSIPNAWDILNFEKLDRDKVEWMTNTVFLNLTESNFTKLKDNFPNLHIKIIEKQADKLFKIWDDISLDENDILLLLKSTLNTVNKTEIIKRIDENYIIENVDIAKYTCDILTESEFIKLSYSVLESLMRGSSVLSNKIDVLNKQFGNLTDSQLQSLVELLGDNYPRIFIKQNKPKFIDTEYNRSLFDKLKERNLIIRYESINDNQLRVIANY